jgi:hypothetical protein
MSERRRMAPFDLSKVLVKNCTVDVCGLDWKAWMVGNYHLKGSPISVSGQEGKWISGSQPFFH